MADQLALTYRPRTFRDLAGQRVPQMLLFNMFHERTPDGWVPWDEPKVPPGLLFTGTPGSGKTTTARIVAAALNCEKPSERPCAKCPSCLSIQDGTSPAVVEIDAASNGTVEQVRKLQELVAYDCGFPFRVVILDEVHSMSRDAFNALLKVLEEPPPRTVFALLTTEQSRVLKTVASRCSPFTFRRIPPQAIIDRLTHVCGQESLAVEPALLASLAERADGNLRDALMLLDQARLVGVTTLSQFNEMHGEVDFAPYLVAAMVQGNHERLFFQVEDLMSRVGDYGLISRGLVHCFRDLLRLHAGGTLAVQGLALEHRQKLAALVPAHKAMACLAVLWDLRTRLSSADPRSTLELAAAMCSERLHPTPEPVAHSNGSGNGSRSVADIRALAAAG
jgi:DNA polymerase III subunit gamma/tau